MKRGLAQLASALVSGARGCRFESCIPDKYALIVQWIEQLPPKRQIQVRFLVRVQRRHPGYGRRISEGFLISRGFFVTLPPEADTAE